MEDYCYKKVYLVSIPQIHLAVDGCSIKVIDAKNNSKYHLEFIEKTICDMLDFLDKFYVRFVDTS